MLLMTVGKQQQGALTMPRSTVRALLTYGSRRGGRASHPAANVCTQLCGGDACMWINRPQDAPNDDAASMCVACVQASNDGFAGVVVCAAAAAAAGGASAQDVGARHAISPTSAAVAAATGIHGTTTTPCAPNAAHWQASHGRATRSPHSAGCNASVGKPACHDVFHKQLPHSALQHTNTQDHPWLGALVCSLQRGSQQPQQLLVPSLSA